MNRFKKYFIAFATIFVIAISSITLFACTKTTKPKLSLITPFKTEYFIDEELDVTNGQIKYTNKNGKKTILDVENSMISNFSTETRGTRTMTLTYKGLSIDIDYSVSPQQIRLPKTWKESLSDDTYWVESIIFDYTAPVDYQKITSIGENGGIEIWEKEDKYALISEYLITVDFQICFGNFPKIEEIVLNNFNYVCTDARSMFNCENLKSVTFPEKFGANITDMANMFDDCKLLTSLDLSGFDTSSVTDMNRMFYECEALSSIIFPQTFAPKVIEMQGMFYNCYNLTTLDLTSFDTSNVINMSEMFYVCRSLTKIDFPKTFGVNTRDMNRMFSQCYALISLDLSGFKTSNVKTMNDMFANCDSLTSINFANFDTSSVTNMSFMFNACSQLTTLDLSNFDTTNVVDMNMMFNYCLKLKKIYVGEKWNTQNATTEDMFLNCGCKEVTKR